MSYYLNDKDEPAQALLLSPETVTIVSVWCYGVVVEEIDPFDNEIRYPALNVQTREGVKRASLGDYVLKHADGTFDVKKPGEFGRSHRSGGHDG